MTTDALFTLADGEDLLAPTQAAPADPFTLADGEDLLAPIQV